MAKTVEFKMPRKPSAEEGPDSFQAGVFAASYDVRVANKLPDAFFLANLPNTPYNRGYKAALPLAKERRREAENLPKFFGNGGFNPMRVYGK